MDEDFLYLIEFEYAWILPLIFSILSNRIWMNILTDSLHHWIFLLPLNLPFYLIEYFCYYLPSILLNIYFCYHLPSILHYKYVVLFIILLYISTYFTLPTYFPHYLTYYLPKQTNNIYIYMKYTKLSSNYPSSLPSSISTISHTLPILTYTYHLYKKTQKTNILYTILYFHYKKSHLHTYIYISLTIYIYHHILSFIFS